MAMKLKNNLSLFLSGIACLCILPLFAQLPEFDLDKVVKFADGKKAIVLKRAEHVKIKLVKGKPEITMDYSEYIMYLNDGTSAGNDVSIPYSENFFSLEHIEAATWIPGEKGYKKIKTQAAKKMASTSSALFYDDMMKATVVFPSIVKNAITELKYTYLIKDPMFAFPFYFTPGFSVPMLDSKFRLEYPTGMNIEMKLFGDSSGIKTSSGNTSGIQWIEKWIQDVPPEKQYENQVGGAYYLPHLFYMIKSYKVKNEEVRLIGNTSDLYKHNYQYIKDLNNEPCSIELKHVADSLVAGLGKEDSITSIKRIYYWIQDHIRYVAFENGLEGYIPRPSNSVFIKRYGDCKDKAALMQFMLKQCGIQSNLVWIGTRDIPYSYADLPLMQSSNHMILAKRINDEWMFFDPTAENLPMGLPSSFIQGKEALISIDETNFAVIKVPEVSNKMNYVQDSIAMKLVENSDLKIEGQMTFGGFARWRFVSGYLSLNEKDKKEYVEMFLKHSYSKAEVLNYRIEGIENRELPLVINYDVTMPDYANKIDDQFYMNLHIQKPMMNEKIKETDRKSPIEYMFQYSNSLIIDFELPEGFKAINIPENQNYTSELISFNREFSTNNRNLNFNSSIETHQIQVNPHQFENWNSAIGILNRNFKESITLAPIKP
jgi:transglutaminase-like putative cysteine protease